MVKTSTGDREVKSWPTHTYDVTI